jgi:hypothetical protein
MSVFVFLFYCLNAGEPVFMEAKVKGGGKKTKLAIRIMYHIQLPHPLGQGWQINPPRQP